jgi:Ca2+-binding RTX toxin-like protein
MVTVNQGAGFGTITGSHAYAAGGIYTITVTLTDDDTGTDVSMTTAVITGVGIQNGVLYVIGTSDDDHVSVNQTGKGSLKVHADFLSENFRTFDLALVDKIIAYLCEGDDHFTISNKVITPAIVHGGDGDDHLNAGGGPTVLLGGNGDDKLVGQGGYNILIGGLGQDRMTGGKKDDVLIGGTTTIDDDDDALMAAVMAWTANDSYENRVLAVDALLSVIDDEERDKLTGSSGRDLFYAGVGDRLPGVKDDETVL